MLSFNEIKIGEFYATRRHWASHDRPHWSPRTIVQVIKILGASSLVVQRYGDTNVDCRTCKPNFLRRLSPLELLALQAVE